MFSSNKNTKCDKSRYQNIYIFSAITDNSQIILEIIEWTYLINLPSHLTEIHSTIPDITKLTARQEYWMRVKFAPHYG